MENISLVYILVAFLGGLVSFLTPCVLPLVPGYIAMISGVSIDNLKEGGASSRRAVIVNSLAFNAGLSIIFLALGAAAGWIGAAVLSNPIVRVVGGIIIILFGLQLAGVLKIGALYRDTRALSNDKPKGVFGALVLGMAFAAGWTPCIGPILGGILGLAATSGGWQTGLVLSGCYSAGLAVPFLVTGLFINRFLGFYQGFRRHLHTVEVVSGVMLVGIGLLVASGYATLLASSSLAAILPNPEKALAAWTRSSTSTNSSGSTPTASTATGAADASLPLAPDVALATLDGQQFRLSELRGRVVLLNFWATWCVPCRSEIPELNAMQRDLETQGLSVVGVSWDDSAEYIKDFQKDVPQNYRVLLDGESVGREFGGIASFPTTLVIDRHGRVRQTIIGERDRAGFEAAIKPLLNENSSTTPSNGERSAVN